MKRYFHISYVEQENTPFTTLAIKSTVFGIDPVEGETPVEFMERLYKECFGYDSWNYVIISMFETKM